MNTSRRDFVKTAAIAGAGLMIMPSHLVFADSKTPKVRLGFIGVGLRGQDHLDLALRRDDVEVVAICDIQQVMIDASLDLVKKSGKPLPRVIKEGPYEYRKLLEMKDIDGVVIATPWEWHSVMSLDAMNAKKYVGCEVIAGMTVEECWDLVNTSERTGMPVMMLENVCYRRDVMAILNNEETILLQHDTSLPRPYSLGFRVQGTKGLWMDVNKSLYLEGVSKEQHRWEDAAPYLEQYDHPLWKRFGNDAKGAGHGGMDFFVLHAFIESIKRKTNTPLDVYDAVTWSAITPLSEASIQLGGESVEFPDFTRGKWMYRKNTFALDEQY